MTDQQRVPERVITRVRPHARALVLPSLMLVVLVGADTYVALVLTELWMRLAALLVGLVLVALLWLLPLLRWLSTQYLITTRRVVVSGGLFVRTRTEVLLSRRHEVTLRRSTLQSVFRSGDVLLNTGHDRPVVLRDVPRADLVQRALADVMEASTSSIDVVRGELAEG